MKNNTLITLVILGIGMITYFVFHYSSLVFHDLLMCAVYQTDLEPNYLILVKLISRFLFLVVAFLVLNKSLIKHMNVGDQLKWPNFKTLGIFGLVGIILLVANIFSSKLEGQQLFHYMERNIEDDMEFFTHYISADSTIYLFHNIALLVFFGYFIYYLSRKQHGAK